MISRDITLYAGIGSRKTPIDVCLKMTHIAEQLHVDNWMLRSGYAEGADQAFQAGTNRAEIHVPYRGYHGAKDGYPFLVPKPTPEVQAIAARFHPKWSNLRDYVKLLMCRNVTIVLGADLNTPVKMVICWTEKGQLIGGTAHGMKIAYAYDIPVFNIADREDQRRLCDFTNR